MLVYHKNPYRQSNRQHSHNHKGNLPSSNIIERNDDFILEMALAGYEKKEIVIDVEQQELKISSKKENIAREDQELLRSEFRTGAFQRSFELPDTVDTENIEANFKNGLLTILLPKLEFARTKPAREISIA